MWRPVVAVLLMASVPAAGAMTVWHDPPARVDAGFHAVDTLGSVDRATVHVRLAADGAQTTKWGIIWNYTDDANYVKATLSLPDEGRYADVYSTEAMVEVVRCRDGEMEKVCSRKITGEIDDTKGMNSLKLVYDGGQATLYVGSTDQKEVAAVPFGSSGGVVAFFCDAPVRVQRLDVKSHTADSPTMSSFATMDELAAHIKASADPMEGFWEYLDRNVDPAKAVLGGRYTLATVRRGDAYDIIYVRGAEVASDAWRPLQVKGILHPTIFRDNYDMEWITTDMKRITDDCDAMLSDDKAVLTLRFPIAAAQLRLRRKPL